MYLFFKAELDRYKRSLEAEVLSLYDLPAQILPNYFCDNAFCSRKSLKNFNIAELVRYCWVQKFHQSALILELPDQIESDFALIRHFGVDYLACVSGSIRKSQLMKLALSYDQLAQVKDGRKLFAVPKHVVAERLRNSPFSEAEILELTQIQELNLQLVDQYIEKKTKELREDLGALPNIFKRSFSLIS
jgi:hypothetical protein